MEEKKQYELEFKGSYLFALVPLILFVVGCILFFVVFKTYNMMDLCTGGFAALLIGSLFSKKWSVYWKSVVTGMQSRLVAELTAILLLVGMFGKLMTRGGVAQGFVWLGDKLGLQGGMFTGFAFVATCIIATATGTSIGTLFTAFPILYPSGLLLGAHPAFLAGAILSGAIFGDNVGPVSDTTIVSAQTQQYMNKDGFADIAGVVGSRMKYAFAAAIPALIIFCIFGGAKDTGLSASEGAALLAENSDPKGLIMLIPVAILLFVAFKTRSIYIAVTWGLIGGTIIGLVSGIIVPADIMSVQDGALQGFLSDGVNNMIGTVGYNYAVAGIVGVLTASGFLDRVINGLTNSKLNQTVPGTEWICGIGLMISSIVLGSANGPAILMYGPVAADISSKKGLHPYRRANLLDGFGSGLPVLIPVTSAFIFICISCVNGLMADFSFVPALNPINLAAHTWHCILLFFVFAFSVFTGWGRAFEGPNGEVMRGKTYDEALAKFEAAQK